MQQKRFYFEIENDLKSVINNKDKNNHNIKMQFISLLKELKHSYDIELTTDFLRILVNTQNKTTAKNRILRLLQNAEVKTITTSKYFKTLEWKKWKGSIKDYKRLKDKTIDLTEYEQHFGQQQRVLNAKIFNKVIV